MSLPKPKPISNYHVENNFPNRIFIFSGAGLSAESGLSTFRKNSNGSLALWDGYKVDEVCNINTFEDNYKKVHDFYNKRRKDVGEAFPNEAHKFIASLEKEYGSNRVFNITTNIDDLLERAGCENVLHLHGFVREILTDYYSLNSDIIDIGYNEVNTNDSECYVKPNVVFFGEMAPLYDNMHRAISSLRSGKDMFIVIGASFEVVKINKFLKREKDIYKININTDKNMIRSAYKEFNRNIIKTATEGFIDINEEIKEFMKNKKGS